MSRASRSGHFRSLRAQAKARRETTPGRMGWSGFGAGLLGWVRRMEVRMNNRRTKSRWMGFGWTRRKSPTSSLKSSHAPPATSRSPGANLTQRTFPAHRPRCWCLAQSSSNRRQAKCRWTIITSGGNGLPAQTGVIQKAPTRTLKGVKSIPSYMFVGMTRWLTPGGRANDCRRKRNGNMLRAAAWIANRTFGAKRKRPTADGGEHLAGPFPK